MRRWTDGKSWGPSRIWGYFLIYRELEVKRARAANRPNKDPDLRWGSHEDNNIEDRRISAIRYKQDGLMKKSFSITTPSGQHLHLISYYLHQQHSHLQLPQPTTDPQLAQIKVPKGLYGTYTNDVSPNPTVTQWPAHGGRRPPQQRGSTRIQGSLEQRRRVLRSKPPPSPSCPEPKHGTPYHRCQQDPEQRPVPTSLAQGLSHQIPFVSQPAPGCCSQNGSPPNKQFGTRVEYLQATFMADHRVINPITPRPLGSTPQTMTTFLHSSGNSRLEEPRESPKISFANPLGLSQAQSGPCISHLVHPTSCFSTSPNNKSAQYTVKRCPGENIGTEILLREVGTQAEDHRVIRLLDQKLTF